MGIRSQYSLFLEGKEQLNLNGYSYLKSSLKRGFNRLLSAKVTEHLQRRLRIPVGLITFI